MNKNPLWIYITKFLHSNKEVNQDLAIFRGLEPISWSQKLLVYIENIRESKRFPLEPNAELYFRTHKINEMNKLYTQM